MAVISLSMSQLQFFIYSVKICIDEKTSLFSAILIQIIPLFSAYGIIFTIDSPFIFFGFYLFIYFGGLYLKRTQKFGMHLGFHSDLVSLRNIRWHFFIHVLFCSCYYQRTTEKNCSRSLLICP